MSLLKGLVQCYWGSTLIVCPSVGTFYNQNVNNFLNNEDKINLKIVPKSAKCAEFLRKNAKF